MQQLGRSLQGSHFRIHKLIFVFLLFFTACYTPSSKEYRAFYQHLRPIPQSDIVKEDCPFFLVILVDARHLDYTDCRSFVRTVAKHPCDGSKTGDVGHAWVYLQGVIDGQIHVIEGGHSGETGRLQSRYFDGIMNNIDYGIPNPSSFSCALPICHSNPISYLWEVQRDGFFQSGSGGHQPTYAIKRCLTAQQFSDIASFMKTYDYSNYSLQGRQCSSFVQQIASLAGLELECLTTLCVPSTLFLKEVALPLWSDPCYSVLTVPSPDVLERSMMQAVRLRQAECALDWYKRTHRRSVLYRLAAIGALFVKFPERYVRYQRMQ